VGGGGGGPGGEGVVKKFGTVPTSHVESKLCSPCTFLTFSRLTLTLN
jgi:hypothetical protein